MKLQLDYLKIYMIWTFSMTFAVIMSYPYLLGQDKSCLNWC